VSERTRPLIRKLLKSQGLSDRATGAREVDTDVPTVATQQTAPREDPTLREDGTLPEG
jgi:hypothetical protein